MALLVGLSLETVIALPWAGIAWCAVVVIGAVVGASAAPRAGFEVEVPAVGFAVVRGIPFEELLKGAFDWVVAWWRSVGDCSWSLGWWVGLEALEVAVVGLLVAFGSSLKVVLVGLGAFGAAFAFVGLAFAFVLSAFGVAFGCVVGVVLFGFFGE